MTAARTILLSGGTGDPARRMPLPSLYGLHAEGPIAAALGPRGGDPLTIRPSTAPSLFGSTIAGLAGASRADQT